MGDDGNEPHRNAAVSGFDCSPRRRGARGHGPVDPHDDGGGVIAITDPVVAGRTVDFEIHGSSRPAFVETL
ncbi:hypothetical protein [Mycobacterium sp. AT1]|uniref:hypothetical protein n=1 Tax=Mycobacterium sp. AT1 TaxID=1961706 RepID=UPI0018E9D892|nr:hypothetical protein [Mycobacterium sp. AT1]